MNIRELAEIVSRSLVEAQRNSGRKLTAADRSKIIETCCKDEAEKDHAIASGPSVDGELIHTLKKAVGRRLACLRKTKTVRERNEVLRQLAEERTKESFHQIAREGHYDQVAPFQGYTPMSDIG